MPRSLCAVQPFLWRMYLRTITNRDELAMIMKGKFDDYEIQSPNYDMDAIRTTLDLPIRF